ncbi:hypothetical protein ABBQ38_009712 [Trebouxia sp. C0009 RCD-2024]
MPESNSEQVLRLFERLSVADSDADHLQVRSLAELEKHLQIWFESGVMSMTTFKKQLRDHAICLGNFTAYHSQQALKHALRTDRDLIVSRKKAKKYKFVKQCLTRL